MADALAALSLPVAAPTIWPPTDRSLSPGDPALLQLGSFAATVLQADCGDAWTTIDPGRRERPAAIDGTRHGTGPVLRTFFSDPRLGYFEPADLPALFVYRAEKASYVRPGADIYRRKWPIAIAWLPPRVEDDKQRREIDPFVNAVSAALYRAILIARHRAWVTPEDAADDNGLLEAAQATSTTPVTLTSFDGAMGGGMLPGRPFQVTTAPATGAYNTTDPILVTGTLDDGQSFTDSLYLTSADGGETVVGVWSYRVPTQVVIPAQLLTTGSFLFGFYRSPDAKLGSLVQRACGFVEMRQRTGDVKDIPVRRPNDQPLAYRGFELVLDISEELDIDLAEHGEAFADPDVAPGITAYINQGNNNPFNSFIL